MIVIVVGCIVMNVLVIMCDGLRYDSLRCNGNKVGATPNIDRLVQKA